MNITDIVVSLQQRANSSANALDLLTLSKVIEKLDVGNIETVATSGSLPTNLTSNGNIFYAESDQELFYNTGASWLPLSGIIGRAYAWGRGSYGRLGDNTASNRSSPVTIVGGILTWTQLSGGGSHSIGLTRSGTAYAWGRANAGELGNNSTASRSSPVTVAGGLTWSQVTAGGLTSGHNLGLTRTGVLYSWGYNYRGQLGINTSGNRSSPVTIVGGLTSWSKISVGFYHSVALATTYLP
jgi:alpha-tubulin suppressor-like RCC1 family protein